MAPRPGGRHPKRVGNTRADAALDAMRQLGFPSTLVRQTLKKLLAAYGGDDGWVFIEEASYKLLIETILDDQMNCGDDETQVEAIKDTETAESSCAGAAKSELTAATRVCDVVLHKNEEAMDSKLQIDWTGAQDDNFQSVEEEEEEEEERRVVPKLKKEFKFGLGNIKLFKLEEPLTCFSRPNRKPFYGWIREDDEDLEPREQLLQKSMEKPRKRSRWDEKPQGM